MEGYNIGPNEYDDKHTIMENATDDLDSSENGQNKSSGSFMYTPRMGLQGKRARIRSQPYKGIGTRTYKNSVFVSNIAYELSEQQFKDLLRNKLAKSPFVKYSQSQMDFQRCVEFENEEDADKAPVKMKKYEVQGRKLVVRDDRDLTFSSRYRQPPASASRQQSAIINHDVLQRLGIHPDDISETIFIAKLADEVDLRKLKDVFSLAGLVMNCNILRDEEGKSIGLATVTFSSSEEAVNAISMFDDQPLYDQKMSVRMDKGKKQSQDATKQCDELPQGLGSVGTNLLTGHGGGSGMGHPLTSLMGGSPMFDSRRGFDRPYGGLDRGFDMGMTLDMGYPSDTRGAFGGGPIRGYDSQRGSHQSSGSDGGTQVFVRNLSSEITWEDLKDTFKKVGK